MTAKRRTPRAQGLAIRKRALADEKLPRDIFGCVACQSEIQKCTHGEAFVGGVIFGLQRNRDAVLRELCPYHTAFLAEGHRRTRDLVPEEDKR